MARLRGRLKQRLARGAPSLAPISFGTGTLKSNEVMEKLRCGYSTLLRWMRQGKLPREAWFKVGRKYLFVAEKLEAASRSWA